MHGQAPEETQVVGEPLEMDGFFLQTDDGFFVLDVGEKRHADSTDRMVDDTIEEDVGIRHEFAHPPRVRS